MMDECHVLKADVFQNPELGSTVVTAFAGQVIYDPQTTAEHVYYVQSGEVRVYMVGPEAACRLVEILGPGDWFGAAALAGQSTYGMRAVAISQSVIVEARSDKFLQTLSQRPEALMQLSRSLAGRLMNATRDASSLVFEDCNQRLINALVRFSRSAASTQRDDGVVLRITHDQLAQAIGVARETVSLALTQLRQQNLLRTGRNQLMFNPDVLQQFRAKGTGAQRPMQMSA